MEIFSYDGENFKVAMVFEGWKIGILRYGDRFSTYNCHERHFETDEAFILLEGQATLYEEDSCYEMEKNKVYNVKKGLWHHIVVKPDTTVLVVENSNTTPENSERRYFS